MSTQIQVKTASGAVFYVEAEPGSPAPASPAQASAVNADGLDEDQREFLEGKERGAMGAKAASKVLEETVFSKAVGVIRGLVEDVSEGLMAANPRPSQVELEFSLGMGASGSVMIFKGNANAAFKLKLTWKMPSS